MADDFELLRDSFRRDLRLRNKADRTIGAYVESVDRFAAWARSQGLTSVTEVTREHVRSWLGELLGTVSAQTTVRHHSGAKQTQLALVERPDESGGDQQVACPALQTTPPVRKPPAAGGTLS